MKTCLVCGKEFEGKYNCCSTDCIDIYFFGSKKKARKVAIENFKKIGIKVK